MPPRDQPGIIDPEANRGKTSNHDTPDVIHINAPTIRPTGGVFDTEFDDAIDSERYAQ